MLCPLNRLQSIGINSANIRAASTLDTLKSRLETELFGVHLSLVHLGQVCANTVLLIHSDYVTLLLAPYHIVFRLD